MNTLMKYREAPNTVLELKNNIFAPYEKAEKELLDTVVYEDKHIKIELKGYKLNQIHRDILDIANYCGDDRLNHETDDIRPARLFSLYDIQKHLNYKAKRNNNWIEEKFEEMQKSLIQVHDKKSGDWIKFNIIEVAQYSKKQNSYAIILSELYTVFFENQISVGYKAYLPQILELSPQSRALVRFVISFSNDFEIGLDKAMEKIGIKNDGTIQNWRYNRNRILHDEKKLNALNIKLEKTSSDMRKKDYKIIYKTLENVKIYHPKPTLFQ